MRSIGWGLKLGASSMLCLVAAMAAGQVIPDAIQACKKEPDDTRRLQCYDREVAKYPFTSQQSFGLGEARVAAAQRQSTAAAPAVKTLTAKVAALRDRPHAGFVVTFDNGQVWMQVEMEANERIAVGDTVTIKPGAFGSFWLVGPSGWSTRVHRVQ